jgi:Ribosomal protein L19
VFGVPVERRVPLHSPLVRSIKVLESNFVYKNRRKVKRAKLYFLRDRNPVGTSCSLWGLSAHLFSCLAVACLTFLSLVKYLYIPRIAVCFRNESNEMVGSQQSFYFQVYEYAFVRR